VSEAQRLAGAFPAAETLRALIEQVPVTVYIDRLDDLSSNVFMSPQLEAVLGYSADEWASDPKFYVKVIHPDDLERVLAEHRRTRETGELFSMEYRMVARDGSVHWFLDEARVIRDETGRPVFHHGFILDITERKELADALRRSEEELRREKQYVESLLEISPVAIVTLDLEERVKSWNPAAEALFGYPEAEAVGRTIEELVLPTEALARVGASIMEQAMTEGSAHRITRRMRKDGALVDVEMIVVPIRSNGKAIGSFAIYHDVSELQRQKHHLQSLLENSPTAIVELDLADTIIAWNPAAETLFGYTRQEAIGRNIDDLVANSAEVRTEAAELNELAREKGHMHVITRRTRRDGSLVDVEMLVAPVMSGGEMAGYYVIYHDIGELMHARREAEEATRTVRAQADELTEWNRTLNARVDEQVEEIERMSKLRRFLTPQVADAILAAGADSVLESHRSEITAVFCDLRGFTRFAEVNEPEDVMRVLREYHTAMGEIIVEYGATLEHFEGDGMMLFFNDPIPVADPANRAVRMAIAMRDRAAELSSAWRRHGYDLGFGLGVARGYATLGRIGFEGRFDYGAVGSVVNMASRLGNAAAAGQILISLRVFAEVEDVIDAEQAGELDMKGFHGPQQVFNVIGLKGLSAEIEARERDSGAAGAPLGSDK
jgi:PAS domain S-box-containing protein